MADGFPVGGQLGGAGAPTLAFTAPERASFFDEQRRRRIATWRVTAACLVLAGAMGLVVSTFLTPLLLLITGGGLKLAAWLGVAPAAARGAAAALGAWAQGKLDQMGVLIDTLDLVHGLGDLWLLWPPLLVFAPVFLPGAVVAVLAWLFFQRVLAGAEADDLPASLGARPPRPGDAEEHQVGNILAEMAIASGLPAPRLLIVDSDVANAAVVGRGPHEATVLVTRGLLDRLDRAETSGVLGHVMAWIGNGDLRVTAAVLALFHTFGFFLTLLDLPFRLGAWRALGAVAVATVRPDPAHAAAAAQGLALSLDTESLDALNRFMGGPDQRLRKVVIFPLLPLILINLMQKMVMNLWIMLGLGWVLALLFRARRYLADATAVQLTRDPDGLFRALRDMAALGAVPEGGAARDYAFVTAAREATGSLKDRRGLPIDLQPSLARRLARLQAQGADQPLPGTRRPLPGPVAQRLGGRLAKLQAAGPLAMAGMALVAVLLLLLVPLVFVLVVLIGWLTLLAMVMSLGGGLALAAGLL
jgi:Zn-dependent protease with chaperone function